MFSNLMLRAVHNANMSDRPGYYSGRGANASDLNSKMLESIYKSIEDGVSKEAAEAFVQMVEDIPVLSATDFLITLSRFEGNKFVWDKSLLSQQKGVYISDASSSVGLGEAFGTVMSAMGHKRTPRRPSAETSCGTTVEEHPRLCATASTTSTTVLPSTGWPRWGPPFRADLVQGGPRRGLRPTHGRPFHLPGLRARLCAGPGTPKRPQDRLGRGPAEQGRPRLLRGVRKLIRTLKEHSKTMSTHKPIDSDAAETNLKTDWKSSFSLTVRWGVSILSVSVRRGQ